MKRFCVNRKSVPGTISQAAHAPLATFLLMLTGWSSSAQAQATAPPFADNFTSPTLNSAWKVLAGHGHYTVAGGQLRIYNEGPL
jgi:hypothetical protein